MRLTQWLVFLAGLSLLFRAGYAVSEGREQPPTSSATFVLTADMPNISDSRPPQISDMVMQAIGLNEVITRNTDFCARYGGEEFVAILPNTDEKGAKIKAQEIREAIESLQIPHSKSTVSSVITASLGVATVNFEHHHNWTLTSILNTADKALYDAKTGGRNRCVYTSLP